MTAKLFKSLKLNHEEPDEETALKKGLIEESGLSMQSVLSVSGTSLSTDTKKKTTSSIALGSKTRGDGNREAAIEFLLNLPGITSMNYKQVMKKAKSIAHLCSLREEDLSGIIGAGGAKKLYTFLHYRVAK